MGSIETAIYERRHSRDIVVISNVSPTIDNGRFPIKRIVHDDVVIEADIFADEETFVSAALKYRRSSVEKWQRVGMQLIQDDRWRGSFQVDEIGKYLYTIEAWVDDFKTWQRYLLYRLEKGLDISEHLLIGAELLIDASKEATHEHYQQLTSTAELLRSRKTVNLEEALTLIVSEDLEQLIRQYLRPRSTTIYNKTFQIIVDRRVAQFSTWYEIFPRSCAANVEQHGTFQDCAQYLPYIADMGFDVLYLPPIHPIGITNRLGKNGTPYANRGDPGSPWAIGSEDGGHKSIHPQLGTLEDFDKFVSTANSLGIEIALDIAFQCSPDHPFVVQHPEWFQRWNNESISLANSFPNKYLDIYIINLSSEKREEIWMELKSVIVFWIEHGVRIFRVDNPHTKPFVFWEWLIDDIKTQHPAVIFLAEAFTRPSLMYHLSKSGFTQSYTYFTWRNTKWELIEYFNTLSQPELRECFRPNLWTNTHDLLSRYLQNGGKPAFKTRLILAATLGASYGIYGPSFELCESRGKDVESDEYLDSEKYEIKHWNINDANSIKDLIAQVNQIRRENPALQKDNNLVFHDCDNEYIICYSKYDFKNNNLILVVVNLNPKYSIAARIYLHLERLKLTPNETFEVYDLLSNTAYLWKGRSNYVEIDPSTIPAHIFRISLQPNFHPDQ